MLKDKKVLAGAAVLLGVAFWFYIKPTYLDSSSAAPQYTDEQIATAPRPTVTLEERVLNLKAPADRPNYVKLVVALEFEDPDHKWIGLQGEALAKKNEEFAYDLEPEMHRVWDVITDAMSEKTVQDVATASGRDQLKEELIAALNAVLHEPRVENIYFVTFVTQ